MDVLNNGRTTYSTLEKLFFTATGREMDFLISLQYHTIKTDLSVPESVLQFGKKIRFFFLSFGMILYFAIRA